jgi:uncharacterized delta-60 repeat protein
MAGIRNFAIQADDKILVAGEGVGNDYVARLLPNGALDSSFNGQGYLTFSFGTNNAFLYNIITQSDGKILVCGNHVAQTGSSPILSVARITTSGVLDTTFGSGGIVSTAFKIVPSNYLLGMAVQSDGKILVGGRTRNTTTQFNEFALVRLNGSGTVDTSFGTDGMVTTSLDNASTNAITKLLVQPDGKIVAGGLSLGMTMVRYLANGALDPNFGNNGVFQDGNSADYCDVVLQPDGKLLLAGGNGTVTSKIFRYTATGVLDTTFANNANVFPTSYGTASNVLLQNDSKILVFGSNYTPDLSQICAVVIRLNNDVLGTEGFNKNEVGVYPNPSTGVINFITSAFGERPFSIYLYTTLGQKVYEKTNLTTKESELNLSNLKSGTYFITFSNNEKTITKTIILN